MILAGVLARSGEGYKSGPIGFAVILLLCVAVYFLFKSMSKHLRKVRDEFPVPADEKAATPDVPARGAHPSKAPMTGTPTSGSPTTDIPGPDQSDTGSPA